MFILNLDVRSSLEKNFRPKKSRCTKCGERTNHRTSPWYIPTTRELIAHEHAHRSSLGTPSRSDAYLSEFLSFSDRSHHKLEKQKRTRNSENYVKDSESIGFITTPPPPPVHSVGLQRQQRLTRNRRIERIFIPKCPIGFR